MSRPALRFTLLGDGTSDAALVPILSWLLRAHLPDDTALEIGQVANLSRLPDAIRPPLSDLPARMRVAVEFYDCDVLFVHRDAEQPDAYAARRAEIADAAKDAQLTLQVIPVVPVRMTEAWLLHDETALRSAAGRPDSTNALGLPTPKTVETAHAKDRLFAALRAASNRTGRRAKRFSPPAARARLAALIEDFSPLRRFDAFSNLERDIVAFASDWRKETDLDT